MPIADKSDFTVRVKNGKVLLNGYREMISSSEAAQRLDVSRARINQLVETDRLRAYRVGSTLFVLVDDVVAYDQSRNSLD